MPSQNKTWLLRALRICALSCLAASAPGLLASDEGSFSLNGFGTLGATRSSSGEAEFVRDLAQPRGSAGQWRGETDTLAGIQARWQINREFSLTAQAISRYHLGRSYTPELAWAFARWQPSDTFTARAGRLATDFYLNADSRQVGYSYLTVRPSGDFFGVLPFAHIDGADAQVTLPAAAGLLRGKVFAGLLNETLPLANRRWKLDDSLMFGASLTWLQGPWTLRASSSELRFEHNLPFADLNNALRLAGAGATADALDVAGSRSRFHSIGGIYDEGPVQLQAMLSHVEHSSSSFQNWWAGYTLFGYRLGEVTPFVGYSWIRSQGKPLNTAALPAPLQAAVNGVLADSHSRQGTTSVGLRWDFAANMDFKIQYDLIRGKPDSIFPFRRETADWNGRTNVLSVVVDFIF